MLYIFLIWIIIVVLLMPKEDIAKAREQAIELAKYIYNSIVRLCKK